MRTRLTIFLILLFLGVIVSFLAWLDEDNWPREDIETGERVESYNLPQVKPNEPFPPLFSQTTFNYPDVPLDKTIGL